MRAKRAEIVVDPYRNLRGTVLRYVADIEDRWDDDRITVVIPEFVVQGGDPLSRDLPDGDRRIGTGGPGYKIKCETAGNPHKHNVGALSMAHAGKDTGGSQFFFTLTPQPHLDGGYTVFGAAVRGVDVLDQIRQGDRLLSVKEVVSNE